MKRKPSALFCALCVFFIVIIFWVRTTPDSPPTDLTSDPVPRESADPAVPSVPFTPFVPDVDTALRLSPPNWSPPAVFASAGVPTPQIPFPRGENATRRYHEPVTTELQPELRDAPPAVLAKTPEDGRTHLLPEEIDLHTRIARRMILDTTALDQVVTGNTSQLVAPTIDDEVITLEFHAVKTRSLHTHTLLGRVLGEESLSDVLFVYHDGVLHGSVARYTDIIDQHLEYRILADGHMMVRELDPTTMTARCGNGPDTEMTEGISEGMELDGDLEIIPQESEEVVGDTPGYRTMDVVVGYDQGARVVDGGYAQIEARIIASVDRMNTAFTNSQIPNAELMLLGTIEDPEYVFPGWQSGSQSDELAGIRTRNNGRLDAVHEYYLLLGADLVAFITRQTDGSAGLANRPGFASVTARDYMTSNRITFAHEIGHNIGCDHSWGDSSQAYHGHYGWRLHPPGGTRVRTIMAYDWGWTRIPYFANPAVSFNGAATGAVAGYNVQGDSTADQRYFQGGLGYTGSDPNRFGFNGSNLGLAANNANTINTGAGVSNYGATFASNRRTRTTFNVTSPAAASIVGRFDGLEVFFTGGDMQDLATIELYNGAELQATIATALNPATHREVAWEIPSSIPGGSNYMIRVTLNSGTSQEIFADSGIFTIDGGEPYVVSHSPSESAKILDAVSQMTITFNQPMNPSSFTVADDVITFSGPTGNLKPSISSVAWSESNTILTLNFSSQTPPGTYTLILGSQIQSAEGEFLDQNRNGIPGETVADRYTAVFFISPPTIYYANMDTDPGWSLDTGWGYGQPSGSGQPTSGIDGPNVIGYRLNGNYEDNIPNTRWATTPAIDCSNHENITLSFSRWLGVESATWDKAFIQVSNNGTNWTTIWQNPNSLVRDTEWVNVQYDISAVADGQPAVYIRWGIGPTDNSVNYSGWNIDEVIIEGDQTGPLPGRLVISPTENFNFSGGQGGPFAPTSMVYTLGNPGDEPINWTAEKSAAWLDISPTSGSIPAGDSITFTVSINAIANGFDSGGYGDTVIFTNTSNGLGSTTRNVNLSVLGDGPYATGGTITEIDGYYIHTFTQGGADTFAVIGGTTLFADILVVGGGGGGGSSTTFGSAGGGGGGAGGLIYQEGVPVSGSLNVVVGGAGAAGGAGNTPGSNGGNSSFGSLVALGGGGGSGGNMQGLAGGSGGGSRSNVNGGAGQQPGSTSGGFGNPGGGWPSAAGDGAGGGGGAAGPAPSAPPNDPKVGGPGGNGLAYDIGGTLITYAGGGGGGASGTSNFGSGGQGGGGSGANNNTPATAGAPNTGGGGGGGNNNLVGANGGSGIVIIRYPVMTSATTFTVEYDGNGNTGGAPPSDQEKSEDVDLVLAAPGTLERTGYTFANWNTAADGSGDSYAAGAIYTANASAILFAQWTANNYTVTYNGNENTSGTPPADQVKVHGVDLTLAANTGNLTKIGFGFDGWNTAADGSGADYAEGAAFTIDADITLYAKWNSPPTVNAGPDQTIQMTGAATWTPAEITTAAWYDASDAEMVIAAGGAVSSWLDKSGNDRHATQTNAALRPVTGIKTIGGKNIIDFNAVDTQSLNIPALDVIGKEVWGVFLIDDYTTSASQLLLGAGGNVQIGVNSSTRKLRLWAATNPYSADTVSNATVPVATPTFAGWLAHTDTKKFSINGVLETTTNTYISPRILSPTFIGRGQFAYLDGAIGEIVITDAALSLEDRQKMEGYLAHKWGLAGNLPAEHPYENVEPGSPAAVAQLAGSASDPEEDPLTFLWTLTEGPAAVVFADPSDPQTIASFSMPGTYTLRLTASDPFGSSYDESLVTVIEATPKPVGSFTISGVPSQVDVGTTIQNITITAMDDEDEIATSFTGTVTFGGTAGITGTSANFVNGVLENVSVTPAIIGSDLTFTVDDGGGHTGSATFSVVGTPYNDWATAAGLTGEDADPGAILRADGLTNLQKFAFGMDPTVSSTATIEVANGQVVTPGLPIIRPAEDAATPTDFQAIFIRRKDFEAAGLIYTVQFSAGLIDGWVTSNAIPTVLTDPNPDSDIEAVRVPYPAAIQTDQGEKIPRFFRVGVSLD